MLGEALQPKFALFERGTSEFANFSKASLAIVQEERPESSTQWKKAFRIRHRDKYIKTFFPILLYMVWVVTIEERKVNLALAGNERSIYGQS